MRFLPRVFNWNGYIVLIALDRKIPYVHFSQVADQSYKTFIYTLIGYGIQELGSMTASSQNANAGERLGCQNVIDQEVADHSIL